jgi:hypothetical protein
VSAPALQGRAAGAGDGMLEGRCVVRTCELHRKVLILAALIGSLGVGASGQVWEVDNQLISAFYPAEDNYFGAAVALGDFDGDGDLDLAIGEPGWDDVFGTDNGHYWVFRNDGSRQLTFWVAKGFVSGTRGGDALAVGDFDDDGDDELAVGGPGRAECAGACPEAGRVHIENWDPENPTGDWYTAWSYTDTAPLTGEHFGSTLAVGDFDDDGVADLAVASPQESISGAAGAGKVTVFYPGASLWQNFFVSASNLDGVITGNDALGAALAAGDFDGNGVDDLAIGAPGRDLGDYVNTGQLHVVHGLVGTGLTLTGQGLLSYASFGQSISDYDRFGDALASGNFDQSPYFCFVSGPCQDDLAIGVPGDDRLLAPGVEVEQVGRVLVSYGSPSGLALDDFTLLSQIGLSETAEEYDHFGMSLAAGRLRSAGSLIDRPPVDLAIGVPEENDGGTQDTGYIHVAFGSGSGVAQGTPSEQPLPPSSGFGAGPAVYDDEWGRVLAIGDIDGDGYGDLVVGLPNKAVDGVSDAGVVQILYGAMYADGFETGGTVNWSSTVTP